MRDRVRERDREGEGETVGERETEGVRERGREEGRRVGEGKRGRDNQRGVKGIEKVKRKMERARRREIDIERGWKREGERDGSRDRDSGREDRRGREREREKESGGMRVCPFFAHLRKKETQSVKTLCSSLVQDILNADCSGLSLFFSLYILFMLNFIVSPRGQRQRPENLPKWTFPVFLLETSYIFLPHTVKRIFGFSQ